MKPSTAALQTYLTNNDTVVICDLYTFQLAGLGILRYVDYPLPQLSIPQSSFPDPNSLNFGSGTVTFARGPRFGRSKVTTKIGIEPASLEIDCYAAPPNAAEPEDFLGSLSWQEFALAGGFDGSTVELDRLFLPANGSTFGAGDGITGPLNFSLGSIIWFYGKMADVSVERSRIRFTVKSLINILQQQQMPRRIFQSGCNHIFGDTMCGYNRIAGQNALGVSTGNGSLNFTALTGSTQSILVTTPGEVNNDFSQGSCVGTTGANAGFTRGILNNSNAVVVLARPFPFAISEGDLFLLVVGCDHTLNTCNDRFQNILRFGGYPYIPPPEIAI